MPVREQQDVAGAVAAAECVAEVHRRLVELLRPGLTLADVDRAVGEHLRELGAVSCFHKYKIPGHPPFPSQSCLSVNDCVVHGTHLMDQPPLAPGDLLSVDVGVKKDGWIGDAAWTYAIAERDEEAERLMNAGIESLRRGIEAMQPGAPLIEWAKAVQGHVEKEQRFHLVRGLGGHGYGRSLHASPFISNVVPIDPREWSDAWNRFEPGMLLAVEPMLSVGTPLIRSSKRDWPIFTDDGSRSVHYEADVLITEDGPRNLTESMFDLPDVVG